MLSLLSVLRSPSPSANNALKYLSFQNHLAAVQIQRCWRGYRCRHRLWSYGGEFFALQAVHIQRCWRGLKGRRRAAGIIRRKVLAAAHTIHGLYYSWHSKRLRLMLRLNFLNRSVVVIQSCFRKRVAIRFVKAVRFALHTQKATVLQSIFRRFAAQLRVTTKRERMHQLHHHLIVFAKDRLQRDALVKAKLAAPLRIHRVATTAADCAQALHLMLSNFVGIGKYDSAFHIALQIAEVARSMPYRSRVAATIESDPKCSCCSNSVAVADDDDVADYYSDFNSNYIDHLRLGCAGLSTGVATAAEFDAMTAGQKSVITAAGLCVDSGVGMGLTAVYLALMSLWTRFGRIRQTRVDYYEEALGYMMQHSIVAQQRFDSAHISENSCNGSNSSNSRNIRNDSSRNNNDSSGINIDQLTTGAMSGSAQQQQQLPSWILQMNDEVVELYFQTALQLPGVVSQYDLLLLLAEWVWFRACVLEHNVAAISHLFDATSSTAAAATAVNNEAVTSNGRPADNSSSDCMVVAAAGAAIGDNAAVVTPMELQAHSWIEHCATDEVNGSPGQPQLQQQQQQLQPFDAETTDDDKDSATDEHNDVSFSALLLQRAEKSRKFALRRVERILNRAQKLLSPDSHDAAEVALRVQTFHDLHMSHHRILLADLSALKLPIKLHYMTEMEKRRRKIQASRDVRDASRSASPMPSAAARRRIIHTPPPLQSIAAIASKAPTEEMSLKLQVVQCNRTILVKGTVSLDHAVACFSDFLEESSTDKVTLSVDYQSSLNTVEAAINTAVVALRPLVLLRHEVELISEICQLKDQLQVEHDDSAAQLELSTTGNAAGSIAGTAVSKSTLTSAKSVRATSPLVSTAVTAAIETAADCLLSAPSIDGNEPLVNSAIARSEEFNVSTADGAILKALDESQQQQSHRSHRRIDYHRISAYVLSNLRLTSCEENFTDAAMFQQTQHAVAVLKRDAAAKQLQTQFTAAAAAAAETSDDDDANDFDTGNSTASTAAMSTTSMYQYPLLKKPLPAVRIVLPVIEFRRYVKNRSRLVEFATELLQRVYRGFNGRQLYRSALRRKHAVDKLHRSARCIQRLLILRAMRRTAMLTKLQCLFRGWRWRQQLQQMRRASLLIQCCARVRQARRKLQQERQRRAQGVPVVQMLGNGRSVSVGGRNFVLRMTRAGFNYRLIGVDAVRGKQYEGAVYKPKVAELLEMHNRSIIGDSLAARNARVMPWQYERVVDVIIGNLGLMPALAPVTVQLGARRPPQLGAPQRLVLVPNPSVTAYRPTHAAATTTNTAIATASTSTSAAAATSAAIQRSASAWQLNQIVAPTLLNMADTHFQQQQRRRYEQKLAPVKAPHRKNVNRATLGGKSSGML